MQKLNNFILLKATFNESLHNAILGKDKEQIEQIIHERYADEIYDGFVILEPLDIDRLYSEHLEDIENDDTDWAL